MRRLRRILAVGAILLLLCLPGSAMAEPLASGTVTAIRGNGNLNAEGTLRAIVVQGEACRMVASATADRIHYEVDIARAGPAVVGVAPLPINRTTERHDSSNATLQFDTREGCRLLVVPISPLAVVSSHNVESVLGSPSTSESFVPHASAVRPSTPIDAADALVVTSSTFSMTGDVRIIAWETNLELTDDSGRYSLQTGSKEKPDPTVPGAQQFEQVEAYLDLYGVNLVTPSRGVVMLNAAHLESGPGAPVVMENADLVGVDGGLNGARIEIDTPATFEAEGGSDRFPLSILSTPAVAADGVAVSFEPLAPAQGSSWWLLGLLLVPLAAAFEGSRRKRRLTRLVEARSYERAAHLAHSFGWVPWYGRQARVAEAVSLLRSENLVGAEAALGKRRRWTSMLGTWEFLRAHLFAAQGDRKAARDSLATCLLLNPGYATDARADPKLRDIIDEAIQIAKSRRANSVEGYA